MLSNVFRYIHRVSHYRWLYWFFFAAKCTGRSCVFSTVVFTSLHDNFIFLWEVWNINKLKWKSACHNIYLNINMYASVLRELFVCAFIFTALLCLIALSSPNLALTCFSPKSEHRCMFFFQLHLEHAGSDTFIVSSAPATLWPASQWFPLYYPPISLCIALSSDSTEHHHQAHFSPNSTDNAGDSPSMLTFLFCLLLTKNSLAMPCNYVLITAVENITDILFHLLVCLSLMECIFRYVQV